MPRRIPALSAAMLLIPVLASGCGGTKKHATTAPAQPSGTAAATAGGVTVSETQYKLTPANGTVKAGAVITAKNDGSIVHAISVEKGGPGGQDLKSADIQPGSTGTVTAPTTPGTYEWYCPIDGHKKLGMKGTLVVR